MKFKKLKSEKEPIMSTYSEHFYEIIRTGASSSADTVAPLVADIFQPSSVVDIGCGEGHWAKAFEDLGCDVTGVDGSYVKSPVIDNFISANLEKEFPKFDKKFDLAVSLEVAEHLSPERAEDFADYYCSLSDNLMFSAAIKGQGGVHHVNEQWHPFWLEKFAKRGFKFQTGALRWIIWDVASVEWWYKQNLFILTKSIDGLSDEAQELFLKDSGPTNLVHPILWESRQ